MPTLTLHHGDITAHMVDAIVNAANSSLLGGGGVDGAIHRRAGPALAEACRTLGGCKTGQAVITPGFALPTRWVIHTVGPVWQGGTKQEASLLEACYRACLALAAANAVQSIAFPSISTGRYRFPIDLASQIAVRVCLAGPIREVRTVCFDLPTYEVYQRTFRAAGLDPRHSDSEPSA